MGTFKLPLPALLYKPAHRLAVLAVGGRVGVATHVTCAAALPRWPAALGRLHGSPLPRICCAVIVLLPCIPVPLAFTAPCKQTKRRDHDE